MTYLLHRVISGAWVKTQDTAHRSHSGQVSYSYFLLCHRGQAQTPQASASLPTRWGTARAPPHSLARRSKSVVSLALTTAWLTLYLLLALICEINPVPLVFERGKQSELNSGWGVPASLSEPWGLSLNSFPPCLLGPLPA